MVRVFGSVATDAIFIPSKIHGRSSISIQQSVELGPDSARAGVVTPSVLRPKPTTKLCHEHRVYVIMHAIEGVDKFLVA